MLCMHCLEEGDWSDEDKCPQCERVGHESPWGVNKCGACKQEYDKKMCQLLATCGITSSKKQSPPQGVVSLKLVCDGVRKSKSGDEAFIVDFHESGDIRRLVSVRIPVAPLVGETYELVLRGVFPTISTLPAYCYMEEFSANSTLLGVKI